MFHSAEAQERCDTAQAQMLARTDRHNVYDATFKVQVVGVGAALNSWYVTGVS
jgi:hypothetical protein